MKTESELLTPDQEAKCQADYIAHCGVAGASAMNAFKLAWRLQARRIAELEQQLADAARNYFALNTQPQSETPATLAGKGLVAQLEAKIAELEQQLADARKSEAQSDRIALHWQIEAAKRQQSETTDSNPLQRAPMLRTDPQHGRCCLTCGEPVSKHIGFSCPNETKDFHANKKLIERFEHAVLDYDQGLISGEGMQDARDAMLLAISAKSEQPLPTEWNHTDPRKRCQHDLLKPGTTIEVIDRWKAKCVCCIEFFDLPGRPDSSLPPNDDLTDNEFRAVFMKTGIPQKIISGIDIEPKDWREFANAARRYSRSPVEPTVGRMNVPIERMSPPDKSFFDETSGDSNA